MIDLLVWTVLVACSIPGIVQAVRALPWVSQRVFENVKPWACDICMSFWIGAFVTSGAAAIAHDLVVLAVAPPAYTLALLLLRALQAPHGEAPPLEPPAEGP